MSLDRCVKDASKCDCHVAEIARLNEQLRVKEVALNHLESAAEMATAESKALHIARESELSRVKETLTTAIEIIRAEHKRFQKQRILPPCECYWCKQTEPTGEKEES